MKPHPCVTAPKRNLKTLLALLIIGMAPSVHAQATFDLRTQWSGASNPNSSWTYAHSGTAMASYGTINTEPWGNGQPGWYSNGPSGIPVWFQATQTYGGNDWQVGDIITHTPSNTGFSDIKWTSPIAGTVDVTGGVWAVRDIGRTQNWSLYLNTTLLVSGTIGSGDVYSRSAPSLFASATGGAVLDNLPVMAGDVLQLRIGTTGDGDYAGVNFTVTAVPEPATYGTIAGLVALALVWVRRRTSRPKAGDSR